MVTGRSPPLHQTDGKVTDPGARSERATDILLRAGAGVRYSVPEAAATGAPGSPCAARHLPVSRETWRLLRRLGFRAAGGPQAPASRNPEGGRSVASARKEQRIQPPLLMAVFHRVNVAFKTGRAYDGLGIRGDRCGTDVAGLKPPTPRAAPCRAISANRCLSRQGVRADERRRSSLDIVRGSGATLTFLRHRSMVNGAF